jgi:hypothetical protein
MKRLFSYCLFLLGTVLLMSAQVGSRAASLRHQTTMTIAHLSEQLHFNDDASAERYHKIRAEITARVHSEIDEYISQAVAPETSAKTIVEDLAQILAVHPNEYSGPPFAAFGNAGSARSLVIAYMLVRGGDAVNDSAVTIRGYRAVAERFKLIARTGQELDGYGLFTQELRSPVPPQQWVLAWGPLYGFNGNKVRMRVYALDGETFHTMWAPEDVLNAEITVTTNGFSVKHLDEENYYVKRQGPFTLRDEYSLTPDGPQKIASYHLPE